jgi:prepilin-type N-terminal cleavage/methylation domain-containing protein
MHVKLSNFKLQISNFWILSTSNQGPACRPASSKLQRGEQAGFTLLELMVVFTITAVVAGMSFFSFTTYARQQALSQTVDNIKLVYDQARNNSLAGLKPNSWCTSNSLQAYQVELSSALISLSMICSGGESHKVDHKFGANVIITNSDVNNWADCSPVSFQALSGGASAAVTKSLPCTFRVVNQEDPNLFKDLTIEENGHITIM